MAKTYDNLNSDFDGVTLIAPDTITVTNEGIVANTGGKAFDLSGGIYTVTINGVVDGGTDGITLGAFAGTTASKVTVGANGSLNGGSGYSLDAAHATNLSNAGIMDSASGIRIQGGDTSFTIFNSGEIRSAGIALELIGSVKATHTITNNEQIIGDINASMSLGADKLTSNGLIKGNVNLGDGANYFISKGLVTGGVDTGKDIDTFLNYNIVKGNVTLGAGNDIMTNNKTIEGDVTLGIGNDKFTNAGEVLGTANISMGDDDDIFVGGKYVDRVMDEDGKDSYDLGDGLDIFDAVNLVLGVDTGSASVTAMKYDIDTIQGGAQTGADLKQGTNSIFGDIYDASDALNGISLNLDSVIRTNLIDTMSTTKYAAYTGISSEIGTDIIKGFEEIWLGSGDDLVFGSVNADKINAGIGADIVYGGKGNDYLLGHDGNDKIIGEAGRDILDGGADDDIFIYRAIADSTLALTGRDRIIDFEDGDLIDLSNIAGISTATLTLDANFNDTVPNGTDAAEIRIITTSFGFTIQVDTTGDNKADMAIDVEVASFTEWGLADFDLIVGP